MNFIFDIGNVLIDFKPEKFLQTLHSKQSDANKMYEIIFQSTEWVQLDQGVISQEEAVEFLCTRNPEYQQLITYTMTRLVDMLTPISGTIALLPEIKAHGHKLYYLSNYHKKLRCYVQAKYPFFSYFDGGVFSCDINMIKPNPEIYMYLLKEYNLPPSECLFIDDVEENVRCAQSLGMMGIVFTDAEDIRNYIKPAV